MRKLCFALAVLLVCAGAAQAALTVVGDWHFDSAPSGFTVMGTAPATPYSGGQMQCDGNWLLSLSPSVTTVTTDFIIELLATPSSYNGEVALSYGNESNNPQIFVYDGFGATDDWCGDISGIGAAGNGPANGTSAAALVADSSSGTMMFYIDGVLQSNDTGWDDVYPPVEVPGAITIGGWDQNGSPGFFFQGTIDRVRISTFDAGTFDTGYLMGSTDPGGPDIPGGEDEGGAVIIFRYGNRGAYSQEGRERPI